MRRRTFAGLIVLVVVLVTVIDIIYFQAIADAAEGGATGEWAPNRVPIFGYQVELGHVGIFVVYWSMMLLILIMDYKQAKNPKRTLQFAAIALILQIFLIEDVLFYLFQQQSPLSVTYTWLYAWNTVLGPEISGIIVLCIACVGCFLAYKVYKRMSHR